MYVRQRTWIERGPGLGASPALVRPARGYFRRLAVAGDRRRRGLGEYPGQACYDPGRPGWYPYAVSTPTEFACVMGSGAAGFYERIQYGAIPRPGDLPPAPGPIAPQTSDEMATWTPEQAFATEGDWEAWRASQRAAIVAAEQSGAYNPEGNLPVTASGLSDFFSRYGTALAVAGVALVGVVAVAGVRR